MSKYYQNVPKFWGLSVKITPDFKKHQVFVEKNNNKKNHHFFKNLASELKCFWKIGAFGDSTQFCDKNFTSGEIVKKWSLWARAMLKIGVITTLHNTYGMGVHLSRTSMHNNRLALSVSDSRVHMTCSNTHPLNHSPYPLKRCLTRPSDLPQLF